MYTEARQVASAQIGPILTHRFNLQFFPVYATHLKLVGPAKVGDEIVFI